MAVSAPKPAAAKDEPKSSHVSDAAIQPFLQSDFDPAEYLNSSLPNLSISSTSARGRTVPLPDLSAQLQTLLSQLNAQTSRLSNILTQLTDDIIRSGSRLEYEVEVLRGETLGLTDAFQNQLKADIELFPPRKPLPESDSKEHVETITDGQGQHVFHEEPGSALQSQEPEFLDRLRTLTTVRERLDSVIKTFGSAMQWPLAPSELSVASSFISVSGPDTSDDGRSLEDKGREHAEKLRQEVNDLLASGVEGLDAAAERVDDLRSLAAVWKGTAEEKARSKMVESLQKLVEDRQKVLERQGASRKPASALPARGHDYRYGNMEAIKPVENTSGGTGYGFLQNLKGLRNDL